MVQPPSPRGTTYVNGQNFGKVNHSLKWTRILGFSYPLTPEGKGSGVMALLEPGLRTGARLDTSFFLLVVWFSLQRVVLPLNYLRVLL